MSLFVVRLSAALRARRFRPRPPPKKGNASRFALGEFAAGRLAAPSGGFTEPLWIVALHAAFLSAFASVFQNVPGK